MGDVRESAYAHHILRLMVLGDLQLLLGVRPWESVEWFRSAFIDGAEWVMAPNAAGMAAWGDGGTMMTKPYAASGRYIDRNQVRRLDRLGDLAEVCAGADRVRRASSP